MTNSYTQLIETIENLKKEGKSVKVTVLPSQINKKRKSLF